MHRNSGSFLFKQCRHKNRTMCISVTVLGGIIIVFLFAYLAFGEDTENSSLQLVSIIFRHGDKTPTETYKNDPYRDPSFWHDGFGQLTIKGKQQMYQLGNTLRSRYLKFFGNYSLKTIQVESSDADRCHQSAGAMLAAMFPPEGDQIWNPTLIWQPIPIHATPRSLDKKIVVKAPCPRYDAEKARSDAEIAKETDTKYHDLYTYLTLNAGQPINSILDVETLYNILEIEADNNYKLPDWTHSVFPDKMKDIATLTLASFTYTPLLKRLWGGPLIKEIVDNMNLKKSNNLKDKKMFIYSAHDITLVNVWRALGFTEILKPEYGASLLFELHYVHLEYQVKLLYLNSSSANMPITLSVPGCSNPCLLDDFINITKPVIPVDWDMECELN